MSKKPVSYNDMKKPDLPKSEEARKPSDPKIADVGMPTQKPEEREMGAEGVDVFRNSRIKSPQGQAVLEHLYPGQSLNDIKKAWNAKKAEANPDEKEDAKLGEKIEEVVEQHMIDNKEAEEKEGHKIEVKKGQSYNQVKKGQCQGN